MICGATLLLLRCLFRCCCCCLPGPAKVDDSDVAPASAGLQDQDRLLSEAARSDDQVSDTARSDGDAAADDPPKDEVMEKLEKLKAMLDAGLIDQDDYDARKQQLLDQLIGADDTRSKAEEPPPPAEPPQPPAEPPPAEAVPVATKRQRYQRGRSRRSHCPGLECSDFGGCLCICFSFAFFCFWFRTV